MRELYAYASNEIHLLITFIGASIASFIVKAITIKLLPTPCVHTLIIYEAIPFLRVIAG